MTTIVVQSAAAMAKYTRRPRKPTTFLRPPANSSGLTLSAKSYTEQQTDISMKSVDITPTAMEHIGRNHGDAM